MTTDREALDRARQLDRQDPLRDLADAVFEPADAPGWSTVYLAGHSLGLQPRTAEPLVRRELRRWREDAVAGWNGRWLRLRQEVAETLSRVVGAPASTLHVGDSTTVLLHQLVGAALEARPDRPDVVAGRHDFPTDLYVLDQWARRAGGSLRLIESPSVADLADAVDEQVGLVALGQVDWRTGALADTARLDEVSHRAGAWTLWDRSHSAGVVELDLAAGTSDLSVGCTYKHLAGGPGAPAWAHVRPELLTRLEPSVRGWFGHTDPFAMDPEWEAAAGTARFGIGTPPVLSLAGALAGVELVAQAGVDEIRAKSVALTTLAIELAEEWLGPLGVTVVTPHRPDRRAAHVTLRHEQAWQLTQLAVDRLGVVVDHRPPDLIRLGLSPLPLHAVDVVVALQRLRDGLQTRQHLVYPATRGGGTT